MKPKRDQKSQNIFVQAITENIKIDAVHVNLGQECIMITEDKAFRCLTAWKSKLEHGKAWIAPLSLFLPLLLSLVATNFKDAYDLTKETWQALFILGVIGSGIWTIVSIVMALRSRGNHTVEALIDQLKKGAVIQRTPETVTQFPTTVSTPCGDASASE